MDTMKYVIGLDGGTQSTKVAIYDLQGRVICEEKASLSPLYSPDADTAEHPGDDLWDSLKATGKGLMAKFQGDPNDIIAIGLGSIRCCRTYLKKDGTTGHSPQSKPIAMMGGLVATRSIGQFSTLYGGIEDMLAGVETVFPDGTICDIKAVPRRSAGPDIRHVVLGNEGAMNFITKVTVKLWKYYPQFHECMGYTLDRMQDGLRIMREIMVEGYRPSVARLYDAEDGKEHFSHFAAGKCVLLFVTEGPQLISHATAEGIREIMAKHPECTPVESKLIETWFANLNWDAARIEEERKEVLETNNVCCTTEISAPWSAVEHIYETCVKRVTEEIPDITIFGAHASHCYSNGINLYFVYWYNVVDCKPEEEITKYHLPIKKIICEETIKAGGSMCHHHGVGKHRVHWIDQEHGSALYIVKRLKQAFDPNGIMNIGTILPYKG